MCSGYAPFTFYFTAQRVDNDLEYYSEMDDEEQDDEDTAFFADYTKKKYAAFVTRKDIALPLNTNTLDDDDESEKEEEDDDNEETNSEEDSDDSEDEGYIEAYCENFRNKSGEGRLQTSYYSWDLHWPKKWNLV